MDFAITGPDTSTTSIAFAVSGNIATAAGQTANLASRCTTDIFSVSNPGGPSPPQICGNNIDQHSKRQEKFRPSSLIVIVIVLVWVTFFITSTYSLTIP